MKGAIHGVDMPISHERFCRLCWFGGKCLRFAFAGSFQSAQNWSGIIGVGLLGALLQRYGQDLMPAADWQETIGQALLFIAAAWVLIFVFRLLVAPFMVYRDGSWHGNKFVYKEPKLVFHAYVSSELNNKPLDFRVRDAPPYSLVNYKFAIDGPEERISIVLMAGPNGWPDFKADQKYRYESGSLRVNRKRDMFLKIYLPDCVDPFSVRVYVRSWTVGEGAEIRTKGPTLISWGGGENV